MKRLVLILLTLIMFRAIQAYAGAEGHGGNLVDCVGKPLVVLDYYHSTLPTFGAPAPALVDITKMSRDEVLDLILKKLQGRGFATQFKNAIAAIGPMENWIEADLHKYDDSAEPYNLPAGCSRKTGAVRMDGPDMYVDPIVKTKLSPAQQGVLIAHEAIYYFSDQPTSARTRTLIRELLKVIPDESQLSAAIRGVGGDPEPGYGIEKLKIGDRFEGIDDSKTNFDDWKVKSLDNINGIPTLILSTYTDYEWKEYVFECKDLMTCVLPKGVRNSSFQFDESTEFFIAINSYGVKHNRVKFNKK